MGYDLHITRKTDWSSEDGPTISPEEWINLVLADPELRLEKDENGLYSAVWSGPSEHETPWIDYDDGNLISKSPDAPLIRKMVQIAVMLGATVQGDDGELYPESLSEPRRPSRDETSPDSGPSRPEGHRPWWRKLLGGPR